jgi:hypothetical protein
MRSAVFAFRFVVTAHRSQTIHEPVFPQMLDEQPNAELKGFGNFDVKSRWSVHNLPYRTRFPLKGEAFLIAMTHGSRREQNQEAKTKSSVKNGSRSSIALEKSLRSLLNVSTVSFRVYCDTRDPLKMGSERYVILLLWRDR